MTQRLPWPALLIPALLVLPGCYEDSTPAVYEPGEYKGERDPLVEKLKRGDMQSRLEERFHRAAQDR